MRKSELVFSVCLTLSLLCPAVFGVVSTGGNITQDSQPISTNFRISDSVGSWCTVELPQSPDVKKIYANKECRQVKSLMYVKPQAEPVYAIIQQSPTLGHLHDLGLCLAAHGSNVVPLAIVSIPTKKGELRAQVYTNGVDSERNILMLWYQWEDASLEYTAHWHPYILQRRIQKRDTTCRLVELTMRQTHDLSTDLDSLKDFAKSLYEDGF